MLTNKNPLLGIIISVARTATIPRNLKEEDFFSLDEILSFLFINDILGKS